MRSKTKKGGGTVRKVFVVALAIVGAAFLVGLLIILLLISISGLQIISV